MLRSSQACSSQRPPWLTTAVRKSGREACAPRPDRPTGATEAIVLGRLLLQRDGNTHVQTEPGRVAARGEDDRKVHLDEEVKRLAAQRRSHPAAEIEHE